MTPARGVATGIVWAFTRSPFIHAISALDVDEMSGGRFRLGMGAGVKRLNETWHNADYGRPAPHLREAIEATRLIMRQASAGEPIRYEGSYYDIAIRGWTRPHPAPRESVPIYTAGVQGGMCRMAGDVADGAPGEADDGERLGDVGACGRGRGVADRVAVLIGGALLQAGTTEEVFVRPINEEVARSLVEEGIVSAESDSATLSRPLAELHLPDSVHAVIRARVDRLAPDDREVLRLASVIGREFDRAVLERIAVSQQQVGSALERLARDVEIHAAGKRIRHAQRR